MKKKILVGIAAALLTVVMCFTLAGCDKSGSVKKAFENEGYTVTTIDTNNDTAKSIFTLCQLTESQIETLGKYQIMLCTKGLNSALVVKFGSSNEIKDFLTVEKDGNKDSSAYDNAKENGLINGNCYLITLSSAAKDIFNKA